MFRPLIFTLSCLSLLGFSNVSWPGGRHAHAHSGFGFYVGVPFWPRPYYLYPPYYDYAPPVITVLQDPPVYIEREPAAAAAGHTYPQGYWYYCFDPQGYYPVVQTCPGGWQAVEPTPPQ
ncbi:MULTISPECIES: hypothetical protein [Methylomonas]|uniref:hypothetical protein n=1 Tax=Methylomonas TaxID=416 RepID=UPI0012318F1E|nr:hypothetical protein [Methylomonas rhizoryzae]